MKVTEFLNTHESLLSKEAKNCMKIYKEYAPEGTLFDMYNDLNSFVTHLKKHYSNCTTRNYVRGIVKALSLQEVQKLEPNIDTNNVNKIMKCIEKDANTKITVVKAVEQSDEDDSDDEITIDDVMPAKIEVCSNKESTDNTYLKQRILDLEEQVAWLRKMLELVISKKT